jgi:hypothetical protein
MPKEALNVVEELAAGIGIPKSLLIIKVKSYSFFSVCKQYYQIIMMKLILVASKRLVSWMQLRENTPMPRLEVLLFPF